MESSSTRRVRWGILSAARVLFRFVNGIKGSKLHELHAIAARSVERARTAATEYSISNVYESYDDILADPLIDIVYIPLPNHLHFEWAMKCLDAGKHVLVEKPLCLHAEEARQLKAKADSKGLIVMEGFMYRFHPQHAAIQNLIKGADPAVKVGDVRCVKVDLSFSTPARGQSLSSDVRGQDTEIGGGVTWDIGCYAVSIARMIFQKDPESIYAEGVTRPVTGAGSEAGKTTDSSTFVILNYGDEKRAVLCCSFEWSRTSSYSVVGTHAEVTCKDIWARSDLPAEITVKDPLTGNIVRRLDVPAADHFRLELDALAKAIMHPEGVDEEGRPNKAALIPMEDSISIARVCECILQSMKEGEKVRF